MASLSCSLPKLCFNSNCNQLLHHNSRRGWRRRTGDFADLCDRCAALLGESPSFGPDLTPMNLSKPLILGRRPVFFSDIKVLLSKFPRSSCMSDGRCLWSS
ncbi:hypothetical protein ACET3Z_010154 [Daucus carota]